MCSVQWINAFSFCFYIVVDLVLIMSVNPGFGGQSFIESQVKKISDLRSLCAQKVVLMSVYFLACNAVYFPYRLKIFRYRELTHGSR